MRKAADIPEANPLVSICIPAYNNASTIMDTVASVLASDYRHLEVVVVDDASSDDTYGLLETIDDDRVRVYRNDSNLGRQLEQMPVIMSGKIRKAFMCR